MVLKLEDPCVAYENELVRRIRRVLELGQHLKRLQMSSKSMANQVHARLPESCKESYHKLTKC